MEQVVWKRRALLVLRILCGLAIIIAGFFYINRAIDEYATPFFVENFSETALKQQVRTEKKKFGLFFKRKKKSKQPKEVEALENATQREVLLNVGMKACVGIMLLFISFLIMLFYLGFETIIIGWLLLVQAGYEAFMSYDFGMLMRYKDLMLTGSMVGATFILILFLWEYMRTHKAYDASKHT